jgi:hypothetical protein
MEVRGCIPNGQIHPKEGRNALQSYAHKIVRSNNGP